MSIQYLLRAVFFFFQPKGILVPIRCSEMNWVSSFSSTSVWFCYSLESWFSLFSVAFNSSPSFVNFISCFLPFFIRSLWNINTLPESGLSRKVYTGRCHSLCSFPSYPAGNQSLLHLVYLSCICLWSKEQRDAYFLMYPFLYTKALRRCSLAVTFLSLNNASWKSLPVHPQTSPPSTSPPPLLFLYFFFFLFFSHNCRVLRCVGVPVYSIILLGVCS